MDKLHARLCQGAEREALESRYQIEKTNVASPHRTGSTFPGEASVFRDAHSFPRLPPRERADSRRHCPRSWCGAAFLREVDPLGCSLLIRMLMIAVGKITEPVEGRRLARE